MDRLASSCRTDPTATSADNPLTSSDLISFLHPKWFHRICFYLCSRHHSLIVHPRPRLHPQTWLLHKSRRITSILLHRLRTNRANLNSYSSNIDSSISPLCPYNCRVDETITHVLITCPKYASHRCKLWNFLSRHRIPHGEASLLGLNPDVNANLNFRIRNALPSFLSSSNLLTRL